MVDYHQLRQQSSPSNAAYGGNVRLFLSAYPAV